MIAALLGLAAAVLATLHHFRSTSLVVLSLGVGLLWANAWNSLSASLALGEKGLRLKWGFRTQEIPVNRIFEYRTDRRGTRRRYHLYGEGGHRLLTVRGIFERPAVFEQWLATRVGSERR